MASTVQTEPGLSQFPRFLKLVPELQDAVVDHMHFADLLRFQQVSRHCHHVASRRIWKSLSFCLENTAFGTEKGKGGVKGRESRFAEALQTLICSRYDYAQHVRSFLLRGFPPDEIASLPTSAGIMVPQLFRFRYAAGSPAQQAISVTLLAMLCKSANLETFSLLAPLDLSDAVWRQLAASTSLSALQVSLHGHQKPVYDPRYRYYLSEQLLNSIPDGESLGDLSYSHIASCSHLKRLTLTHISELNYLNQIAACIRRCSSTLTEVCLSISEALYDKARKPASQSVPAAAQIDPLLVDDFDDASIFSDEELQPAASHVATQAEKDSIHSNKTAQESILAQVFSVEPGDRSEKVIEKALKAANDSSLKSKKPVPLDEGAAEQISEIVRRLLKGDKMGSNDLETIEKLRSQLNQASKSRKKAKVKQSSNTNLPKAQYSQQQQQMYAHLQMLQDSPSATYWHQNSVKPVASQAYAIPKPYPMPSAKPLASGYYAPGSKQWGSHTGAVPSTFDPLISYDPFGEGAYQLPSGSSLAGKLNGIDEPFGITVANASSPTKKAIESYGLNSKQLAEVLKVHKKHATPTTSSPSVDDFDPLSATNSASVTHDSTGQEVPYEDMNIDIEHPDEISGESGDDQESADEVNTPSAVENGAKDKGKGKGKERNTSRPASPCKRVRLADSDLQSPEDTLKRWVRESHGLALRRFSLYRIPLKASVMARALQVRLLQEVVLLGVGGQGPFWQMMMRANEEGPLELSSIHTDDVSRSFIDCLSHLKKPVKVLLLRKRSKKDKFNTTTKEAADINEIRRAVQPHIGSLRVMAIQNDEDGAWNLTTDLAWLIALRAHELEELAFRGAQQSINDMLVQLRQPHHVPKLKVLYLLNSPDQSSFPSQPGGTMGSVAAAAALNATTIAHNAYSNALSNVAYLLKDCVRFRKAAGDKALRHACVQDQLLSIGEVTKSTNYPEWLVEEYRQQQDQHPGIPASLDEWAQKEGVAVETQVAFKNVTLSRLERLYKIFSPQVIGAKLS